MTAAQSRKTGTRERLLYSREQVAEMLGGISTASVRRLERAGTLRPVRLTRRTGMVFFKHDDVLALIEAASNDADQSERPAPATAIPRLRSSGGRA
jgi:hypothetical protein